MRRFLIVTILAFCGFAQAVEVRPYIQGPWTDGGTGPGSGCWIANQCSVTWSGQISVLDQQYVNINGVKITESAGRGIEIQRTDFAAVRNVQVDHTARAGVIMIRSGYGIISNVQASRAALCHDNRHSQKYTDCPLRPAAVTNGHAANAGKSGGLIENTFAHSSYAEGISCWQTSYCIVRGNRVADLWSAGIYADGCEGCVFEHNIMGSLTYPVSSANGFQRDISGTLSWSIECYPGGGSCHHSNPGLNGMIRNNLITNLYRCASASVITGNQSTVEPDYAVGYKFYGNTCWAPKVQWFVVESAPDVQELDVQNNLFVGASGKPCNIQSPGGLVMQFNGWDANPGGKCVNTQGGFYFDDPLTNETALNNNTISGLTTFTDNTLSHTGANNAAKPGGGSPASNAGNPALVSGVCLDKNNYPNFSDITWGSGWLTNWHLCLAYDIDGTARGSTPDIGAVEI